MSKKSRWESLRRRALGNTFDGLDVENLSQLVEVLRSDMKWEQMDVLVVNTNYILDAACSRCKSTTRNQAMYAAVARASIQFINELMILFRPVNMVICSDGALPYGLRRGVRVDNCNSEAFHVAGENWAKGVGWERPYSCADRNLGQAFSPGSMMYSVLDKNILELVQGQMTLQGEGGTSVLYLPHSEIGSWEKKTAALLNIMQVVVDSSESAEEEASSGASKQACESTGEVRRPLVRCLVLDATAEITFRLLLNPSVHAVLVYTTKRRINSGGGQSQTQIARVHSLVDLTKRSSEVIGNGMERAGFIVFCSMLMGSQVSPPLSDSPFVNIESQWKEEVSLHGMEDGWRMTKEACGAFSSRGIVDLPEMTQFTIALAATVDRINSRKECIECSEDTGKIWEAATRGVYVHRPAVLASAECVEYWKAQVWNLCNLGWKIMQSHLDGFSYPFYGKSTPSSLDMSRQSGLLEVSVDGSVFVNPFLRLDRKSGRVVVNNTYVDNYGRICRSYPESLEKNTMMRHVTTLIDLQYLTTSVANVKNAYPEPNYLYYQIETKLLADQFTELDDIGNREVTCRDVGQPALLRPLQVLTEFT